MYFPFSRQLGDTTALFGSSHFGMAGEQWSFCARSSQNRRLDCTQFHFTYGAQVLRGIRFSADGNVAVAFGREFTINNNNPSGRYISTNIAIARAPHFDEWVSPRNSGAVGNIADASVSLDNKRIALVVGNRVEVYALNSFEAPEAIIPIDGVRSVSWLSNGELVAVDEAGIIRAVSTAGVAIWNEFRAAALFLSSESRSPSQGSFRPTWWVSANSADRLMLVGNGASLILMDTRLGAQLMRPMEWKRSPRLFDRPMVYQRADGSLELAWKNERFQRAGLREPEDISTRTGIRHGSFVDSLMRLLR